MATIANGVAKRPKSWAPDSYERILSAGAVLLLLAVAVALARGRAQWGQVPGAVWLHLATIVAALALTPVMLLRRRGDRRHRLLGRVWVAAMLATALISFTLHPPGHRFSIIHILSVWTLIQAPLIWWSARHHKVEQHRGSVRGMVTGALLVAGFFTFPFNRLLGSWLFG